MPIIAEPDPRARPAGATLRPPDLQNLAPATDTEVGRGHLSTTGLGDLLACEQRWLWKHEQQLEPAVKPVALGMGSAFAGALDAGDPEHAWNAVIGDWQRAHERHAGNPWVAVPPRAEAELTAQVAREAARAYLLRWGAHEIREHPMRVRLRNPHTGYPSTTFDLVCRVDGLDLAARELIEDKLVSKLPRRPGEMDRRLRLDRQVSINCYSVWRTTGVEIARVSYRVTLKPQIKQRRGRATRDGGRSGTETHDEFLTRIADEYRDRPEHYLDEFVCTRTADDMLRLELELWRWAEQLRDARRDRVWPRNSASCEDYGGCVYLPLCAREPGAAHQFTTRAPRAAGMADQRAAAVAARERMETAV